MIQKYRNRLSGPSLDRIVLQIEAPGITYQELSGTDELESSAAIGARVGAAGNIQRERLAPFGLYSNSAMADRHIHKFHSVDEQGHKLLEMVTDRLGLSARSHSRILTVARTIANLAGEENTCKHISQGQFCTGGWISERPKKLLTQ